MGTESIIDRIKDVVAGISFKIFLWSINKTQEQYWHEIYIQEKTKPENK